MGYYLAVDEHNVVEYFKQELEESLETGFFNGIFLDHFISSIIPKENAFKREKFIFGTLVKSIFTVLKPYWDSGNKGFVKEVVAKFHDRLTYIEDDIWNSSIWNGCLNMSNDTSAVELLDVYVQYANYKIKTGGNPIRDAIYSNRIEIAKYLLKKGYSIPESISLFQLNNMISWDPVRLQFLLDNGCILKTNDKEKKCLDIIQQARLKEEEN